MVSDNERLRQLAYDIRLSQRRRPASRRDNDALALANGTLSLLDEVAAHEAVIARAIRDFEMIQSMAEKDSYSWMLEIHDTAEQAALRATPADAKEERDA